MKSSAKFSFCRRYRYTLQRHWGEYADRGYVMFIGLNPSTADETKDDPTLRRCICFAKSWGYDGVFMLNLFALRSTDPIEMRNHPHPIGPQNNFYITEIANHAELIVAAWGNHGVHHGRDAEVRSLCTNLHYLRLTKSGQPGHPLYLPRILKPVQWLQ